MLYQNKQRLLEQLKQLGIIIPTATRGKYTMLDDADDTNTWTSSGIVYETHEVINELCNIHLLDIRNGERYVELTLKDGVRNRAQSLRTINRNGYHCGTRDYDTYLNGLRDAGFDYSFGLEYEIGNLTPAQEHELAQLLDTLPAHITERDSSLGQNGVELVFMPMSDIALVSTFNTLKRFVIDKNIDMQNTGAHITFGSLHAEPVALSDLQLRLSRLCLVLVASTTISWRVDTFGRDFNHYCEASTEVSSYRNHFNAFSVAGRTSGTCYEFRLPDYRADIEKVVKMLKSTDSVFDGAFGASAFHKFAETLLDIA